MSPQHQKNNNDNRYKIDRASAILTLNSGLLSEAFPSLRAAKIDWNNEEIRMFFYYDGEISEDDHESAECAATEVMAHFPDYEFKVDIIRCDEPKSIPEKPGIIVYRRKEKSLKTPVQSLDQSPDAEFYTNDDLKARLSIIVALQGEISPYLRKAKIGWTDKEVHLYFYYDGNISDDDRKSAERVSTKVFANFPEREGKLDITRLDYPARIPDTDSDTVYARKEAKPPDAK